MNDLRTVMGWMHTWAIPEQVAIGQSWRAFDLDGNLLDDHLAKRLDAFDHSLVDNRQKLGRVSQWERAAA
ncbi:hypothetical protein BST81_07490 [Leptolyngbya sp. 'hensonii']|uniref:NADPH-dependent FMN reductase n=1 Tax=Leptolyngbya sp. 'hensonii' TaxID=1922337 RepID=UPI00094FF1C7|nr:hypothetical protein [Leptolyngbya sp. 'hensonii']OLP19053.1 hypothetical protein BST81_07490 [Leptolyngbya sp. 'hensonii']